MWRKPIIYDIEDISKDDDIAIYNNYQRVLFIGIFTMSIKIEDTIKMETGKGKPTTNDSKLLYLDTSFLFFNA